MKLFGLSITKAAVGVTQVPSSALGTSVGWWGTIAESFAGAWQRNITVESTRNQLAFSAVYACVKLISSDIAKLRPRLMQRTPSGVWSEVESMSPFLPVLRKPNRYETRVQFIERWIISKLIYGNTYVLKERDQRGVVVGQHVLDARLCLPLVTEDGGVYYDLNRDSLSRGTADRIVVPAREIIHDRMTPLWHPLIGVSPIFASGSSATQGIRIQNNSEIFFRNMSRPSGTLTAPGTITDSTALRLKTEFEQNFAGANIGRLLVAGDGLKYEPMTIPAQDAQLIEQLKWTVEDVARAFGVPLHKLSTGQNPTFNNVGALNQDYYSQTLQIFIEAMEVLQDEGLELANVSDKTYGVELDLEGLLRMDPLGRAEAHAKAIGAGYGKPNEARIAENREPVPGGDTPYMQQQNWSLASLDARPPPTAAATTPPPVTPPVAASVEDATPTEAQSEASKALAARIIKRLVAGSVSD